MRLEKACIPLGGAWTSPFARWQGPLAEVSSLDVCVAVTKRALEERGILPTDVDQLVLGWTIPQPGIFYGAPTVAARIGAPGVSGPMVSQACATAAAAIAVAAACVEAGDDGLHLVLLADRTSNGPHLAYASPSSPGGTPLTENWVLDSFQRDPWAGRSMVAAASKVAADEKMSREEIDDVTALRYEQYARSLADDRDFQRRCMVPVEIPQRRGSLVVDADTGVQETSRERLARLDPIELGGVVTYGSQTHPADGTAGLLVTSEEKARRLGKGGIVRLLGYGVARLGKSDMSKAPVPAAAEALRSAGLDFADVDAITTHNPFAVNDVWFARATGIPVEKTNVYGSSLVYGHPQAPTGARAIVELVETLRSRGGGIGLFTGCAAGDSAAAIVLKVDG